MGSLLNPPDLPFTAAEEDVESSLPPPVANPSSSSDARLVDYKIDLNHCCQSPNPLEEESLPTIEEDGLDMPTFSKSGTTQKKSKMANGVNLRKSLAWNSAFFTEEGVLNPLELSVLGGSSLRSKEKILSLVNGQMSPLLGLHERSPAVGHQKSYGKMVALSASKDNKNFKEENLLSKLNASIPEEQQEGEGIKYSSKNIGKVASRLATPSSQKRTANTNAANRTSKIPKFMPAKSHTASIPRDTRDAIPCVRNLKSNTSATAVDMEHTLQKRCFQSNIRNQSACPQSMKPSAIYLSRPLVPLIDKGTTENLSVPKVVKRTSISSITVNGSSPLPKKVHGDAIAHAKPSGLRMPSPSLGFFQQGKLPPTGIQSQRSVHLCRPTIPLGKTMGVTPAGESKASLASTREKTINGPVAPKYFARTTTSTKMENSLKPSSLSAFNGNVAHPSSGENASTIQLGIDKEVPYASNSMLQIGDKACSLGELNETWIDERPSSEDNSAKQSPPSYRGFATDAISGQDEQATGNLQVNPDAEFVLSDLVDDFSSLPAAKSSLSLSKHGVDSSIAFSSLEEDCSLAVEAGTEDENNSYLRSSTEHNSDTNFISNSEIVNPPSEKPGISAKTVYYGTNYSPVRLTSVLEDSLTSPSANCQIKDHTLECVNEDHINSKEEEYLLQDGSENEQKEKVKQDIHRLKLNAVPFSEEWLAAIETFGEDILELKTGPVQNSPTDKTLPEPGPWSPMKRKAQDVGPFDCTKHSTKLSEPTS
ncbi:uncharacterized protein LOC122018687 isoform X1 [Zingiber officinale]|uniref:uncharacterized protein LOC122018687 isoform X1 n=2 Tax=Zingiber officinale TaxID=94328 RepID=UPI001C4D9ED9|nr:uncharacterized protein LOC122018687 isoform X1 [Zingiber officinale]